MTDLVTKLRAASDGWSGDAFCVGADVADAGADEIERLRTVLATVAVFIEGEPIANAVVAPEGEPARGNHPSLLDTINAALASGQSLEEK